MKKDEVPAIDAVIMWVDGNDPFHKEKMETYLEHTHSVNNKSLRTRYDHVNEIEFCVKSILKYAEFVRNIFIVTDNQIPDFLKDREKAQREFPNVFIVDHKVIFEGYTQYLPTFNSRSIATMIHRIPGLSSSFVIFNDDVFLIKKVIPTDFFINNKPVIRGVWKPFDDNVFFKKVKRIFLQRFNKVKL
ncbi:stealth family protein, partial [Polaribacter sp.]|nr:stealth family protein [Polaribacter sp.]